MGGVLGWLGLTCPTACACLLRLLRPGVLSKTLSHIWGKLNLPIFLFNERLFTLMNMDSLIFLAKPYPPSLPIIWKLCWVVGWPVLLLWWCIGEGSFRCSMNLSSEVLEVSPMYLSWQVRSPHWNQYITPLLLAMGSLSLGEISRFLMVLLPLKWVCMPYLPQIFLMLLQRPWVYGITIWPLFVTSLVGGWAPVVSWLLAPSLTSLADLVNPLMNFDKYIGETFRTSRERFIEHLKDPSPIHHHSSNTGHPTTQHNFQIIGREGGYGLARNIKESIFIRVNNLSLNKNIGKFNLPHIWDRVLLNTPGLKSLKRHAQAVGHVNPNQPNTPPI